MAPKALVKRWGRRRGGGGGVGSHAAAGARAIEEGDKLITCEQHWIVQVPAEAGGAWQGELHDGCVGGLVGVVEDTFEQSQSAGEGRAAVRAARAKATPATGALMGRQRPRRRGSGWLR